MKQSSPRKIKMNSNLNKPTVVIVMPAWNEAKNLEEMFKVLTDDIFPKLKADMHLLVVDNHSTDNTDKIFTEEAKKHKNIHLIQQKNKGLGWAYVTGMQYAMEKLHADAILEMDADFQHPPQFVIPMVEAYLDGAEYAIGSRYVQGGSVPREWEFSRRLVSSLGNLFIRLCLLNFKIHDLTTGFRLSKVEGVLNKIDLENLMELNRFAYKVDLLYQSLKLSNKTVEVPLQFASRTREKSKFNYKEMLSTFKVAMILGLLDKQKFIKFAFVGLAGFVVNSVFLVLFPKLGFAEILSWALSTELAIMSNFTLNNIWTFKSDQISGIKKTLVKFLQFNLSSSLAIVIQAVLGTLAVSLFGPSYRILYLFVIIVFIVMPLNYFIYNRFIWKKKK